jgi:hypothetical protein
MAASFDLTGLMGQTDPKGRLTLYFVERLAATDRKDTSMEWLRTRAPKKEDLRVPYRMTDTGQPDADGIRGMCWATLNYRGARGADRKRRILELADQLRGEEVVLTVQPRFYEFESARGTVERGTMLQFVGLERLRAAPAGP